jgi:hypothetical protein
MLKFGCSAEAGTLRREGISGSLNSLLLLNACAGAKVRGVEQGRAISTLEIKSPGAYAAGALPSRFKGRGATSSDGCVECAR